MRNLMAMIFLAALLASCAAGKKGHKEKTAETRTSQLQQSLGLDPYAPSDEKLLAAIAPWMGTPYRFGGQDKKGVDCSGFIFQVFREAYGKEIPRKTSALAANTKPVARHALKEGDILFFTINTKEAGHAGIFLNNGAFVHASTSKGVMVSRLTEAYWSKYFTGAGRVVP